MYPIDRNVFDQSKFLPASVTSPSIDDNIDPEVAVSAEDAGIAQVLGNRVKQQHHFHK